MSIQNRAIIKNKFNEGIGNGQVQGERTMNSNICLRYTIEFDMLKSKILFKSDLGTECPDEVLIAAYMCYLGRFYYIAENSISEKVREYLNSTFSDLGSNRDLKNERYIRNIYNMTMETLPASKQKAILDLDRRIKLPALLMPYPGPSLSYSKTADASKRSGEWTISTFVFDWSIKNNHIREKLNMPLLSPHVLFVPLSLAFMTKFTIDNIKDEKFVKFLAKMICEVNARIPCSDRKYLFQICDICTQYNLI